MAYVILVGKKWSYLDARCPSCDESYRYIDGNQGEHRCLITDDNPNATVTKCIVCGGYQETHWGDVIYMDSSLKNHKCPGPPS